MAQYCCGCWNDISGWDDSQHYVGGSAGMGAGGSFDYDYVFCASCWTAMEDWFLNTNIDKAIAHLCSGCSAAAAGTHHHGGTVAEIAQFYGGISAGITAR